MGRFRAMLRDGLMGGLLLVLTGCAPVVEESEIPSSRFSPRVHEGYPASHAYQRLENPELLDGPTRRKRHTAFQRYHHLQWREVEHDGRVIREAKREIHDDLRKIHQDQRELDKDLKGLRKERQELRRDIGKGAKPKEIAWELREINEDLKEVARDRKELQQDRRELERDQRLLERHLRELHRDLK